jgi:type IV secretion system protein TrbG
MSGTSGTRGTRGTRRRRAVGRVGLAAGVAMRMVAGMLLGAGGTAAAAAAQEPGAAAPVAVGAAKAEGSPTGATAGREGGEGAAAAAAAQALAAPTGLATPAPAVCGGLAADVAREARAAAEGKEPAVLQHGDSVLVPFGHQVPVLRCAPLRVCLIELEEGELVLNTVTGDAARWILDRAVAGPRGATAVVVVKPTACNLTTNLAITTNRRIYQLTLDARACRSEAGENPDELFTRLLRFYYPDEVVRTWASADEAKRAAAAEESRAVLPLAGGLPLGALHFDYRWTRSGRFPWVPVAVFDDRVHTYIRLPGDGAVGREAPVLFLIDAKGATAVLNYAIRGSFYVADRVFDRAALVIGSGREQQRLEITRER